MKTVLAAIAIAFAVPAAAQTAPAEGHDQHSRHGEQGSGHGEHKDKKMPCGMTDEECRKACADMHGKRDAADGHSGHGAPKS